MRLLVNGASRPVTVSWSSLSLLRGSCKARHGIHAFTAALANGSASVRNGRLGGTFELRSG